MNSAAAKYDAAFTQIGTAIGRSARNAIGIHDAVTPTSRAYSPPLTGRVP